MVKLFALCLVGVMVCSVGSLPTSHFIYPQFPDFTAVYHGHGATSYQNVQVHHHDSVAIPNDLQVDDGHQHSDYSVAYVEEEAEHVGHSHYEPEHYELEYEYH